MSCCSCPVQPCPSRYAAWLPRIGFGVALAAFGVNHYRFLPEFVQMTQGAFPTVPALGMVFGWLAYVFPLLEIVGGVAFMLPVANMKCLAKMGIMASLGGIMGWAGLALALGDGTIAQSVGPAIQGACVMLVAYWVIKKMSCCGCGPSAGACGCGKGGACACPTK